MRYRICLLLGLLPYSPPIAVLAQEPAPSTPFVGLTVSGSVVPDAFPRVCREGTGSTPVNGAELRLGVSRGPIAIESRSSLQALLVGMSCIDVVHAHESGLHASREYPFSGGEMAATDLRVRLGGGAGSSWTISTGAGRVWTHSAPYLVAGVGLRAKGGRRWRWLIDTDLTSYRIAIDEVTREWENHRPLREAARERQHEWRTGLGLRLGGEWLVR